MDEITTTEGHSSVARELVFRDEDFVRFGNEYCGVCHKCKGGEDHFQPGQGFDMPYKT